MSFRSSALILALCSLAAGVLSLGGLLTGPGSGGSYAVLTVDAAHEDRYIGELLSRGGVRGYLSESTQWVFLNDFGELRRIPLDEYRNRLESFDPRNDGYAEKLASFFVREGKRFFFIPLPLPRESSGPGFRRLETALSAALGGIPFSLSPPGTERPLLRFTLLFVLAAGGALLFSRPFPGFAGLFPPMAVLIPGGSPGLALCAILCILAACLRQPLEEFFAARRYGSRVFFRFPLPAALILLLFYGGVCFIGPVRPAPALAVLAGFFLLLPLGLWAGSNRGGDHIRFTPVPIMDRGGLVFPAPAPLLAGPFVLASLLALLPLPALPGPLPRNTAPASGMGAGDFPVSREDYERHALFQAAFSVRPLGDGGGAEFPRGGINQSGYLRYYLGDDGLIAGTGEIPGNVYPGMDEAPPFPLEGLMEFLSGGEGGEGPPVKRALAAPCLVLIVLLPALFRRGSRHERRVRVKMPILNDKRIAA